MNRADRRAAKRGKQPQAYNDFQRELTNVVNGDPTADATVAAWFDDFRKQFDIEVALPHPDGVEVLRRRRSRAEVTEKADD